MVIVNNSDNEEFKSSLAWDEWVGGKSSNFFKP